MIAGVRAKGFPPAERLAVYRVIGAIQRVLVFWGAILVVVSGFALSMPYMRTGVIPGWLAVMMLLGLVAALGAVGLSVPTAARLARLELDSRGELPEAFAGLRRRQAIVASVAGGLGLLALVAGTVLRLS